MERGKLGKLLRQQIGDLPEPCPCVSKGMGDGLRLEHRKASMQQERRQNMVA